MLQKAQKERRFVRRSSRRFPMANLARKGRKSGHFRAFLQERTTAGHILLHDPASDSNFAVTIHLFTSKTK